MNKTVKSAVIAFTLAVGLIPSMAHAIGVSGLGRSLKSAPDFAYIKASRKALTPIRHLIFCKQHPGDCRVQKRNSVAAADIRLTNAKRNELYRINLAVNRHIRPQHDDPRVMGGDLWSLAPAAGDCEDYAITKRHELIAKGWPSSALRLAIAKTRWGEGQMVLVVKTSQGDLVLDNRYGQIKTWDKTDLSWEKIQSAKDPKTWLAI